MKRNETVQVHGLRATLNWREQIGFNRAKMNFQMCTQSQIERFFRFYRLKNIFFVIGMSRRNIHNPHIRIQQIFVRICLMLTFFPVWSTRMWACGIVNLSCISFIRLLFWMSLEWFFTELVRISSIRFSFCTQNHFAPVTKFNYENHDRLQNVEPTHFCSRVRCSVVSYVVHTRLFVCVPPDEQYFSFLFESLWKYIF